MKMVHAGSLVGETTSQRRTATTEAFSTISSKHMERHVVVINPIYVSQCVVSAVGYLNGM